MAHSYDNLPRWRAHSAPRIDDIEPFEVMDVLARANALERDGHRVIHLEIGEPDFTAPEAVVEAGVRALRDGRTSYTATLGLDALRDAIAAYYMDRFRRPVGTDRIVVTSGASGALLLVVASCVAPGDEVLVPDPGYPGYRHMIRALEGRARALPLRADHRFQPILEDVQHAWGPRTTGIILGTPANPVGTVLPHPELERIARFVAERDGVLIVDETYQGLVYGQAPATAIGLPGSVFVVNSFSKYFCMTGWRLGWAVLPAESVRGVEKLAQHLYICAPTPAQYAALAAFQPETLAVLEDRRDEFARRRDFLVTALARTGLRVPAIPDGAFYVYADCASFGNDGRMVARDLLEEVKLAITPGCDFGSHEAHRFVRLAYTRPIEELSEAVRRLEHYSDHLRDRQPFR